MTTPMPTTGTVTGPDLFSERKPLGEIVRVPEKIISVYSLEQHVWADNNSDEARKTRRPELRTIEEFQIEPVRPFLNDVLRKMAAPWNPKKQDEPVGQGYWIQAEFGSGKSHLLCFLSALAIGDKKAWELVRQKEERAGRGKRESLYRFYEEGIAAKSAKGKKGLFVVVKTLVGQGGGVVGMNAQGRPLTNYILDAFKDQLLKETGKNLSLFPAELLADRFVKDDLELYRGKLAKFLKDPAYFDEEQFEDVNEFIAEIQRNKNPEYKRSCGNKLWRFYTDYLKVQPTIAAETEDVLRHLVETVLAEGYSGVLLVLDEVSLFMKNRDEDQRTDDEQTLVVLANRLARAHNLPVWTVCAAQQAIESKLGVKNIIADDRLKQVNLLEGDRDYYKIVLSRVREIVDPVAIAPYYLHYKRGFSWPASLTQDDFAFYFPFPQPALEVLRLVTANLTTARTAIQVMHQTLKHHVKMESWELIRLWEMFDETVQYEEDPSGVYAGLASVKSKFPTEYSAYEAGRRQIDGLTKGLLKVYRDKAVRTLQSLFLYHIARNRTQGLTADEIANAVLIERDGETNVDENVQHYETIASNLKKELRQIAQTVDEDKRARYRFDPVVTGIDPREEFQKARDKVEADELRQRQAWERLLGLEELSIGTRLVTMPVDVRKSIFHDVFDQPQEKELVWQGRLVAGQVGFKDLARLAHDGVRLPPIQSDETDRDFAVWISARPVKEGYVTKLLDLTKDPRVILWTPDEARPEERDRIIEFGAYLKLLEDWSGKDTEDALTVFRWVAEALKTDLAKITKVVDDRFSRGSIDALGNRAMDFHVAGELSAILTPVVSRVLSATYASANIVLPSQFAFKKEDAVKVINGLVKVGEIPKGAKPNQNVSAAQNFAVALQIAKKSAERKLDVSGSPHARDILEFVEQKLKDGGTLKVDTLYKNFMGIGGPKDYGLSRRMIQIYLLAHVRDGRLRVGVGPKSGLPMPTVDYSNIADVEFTTQLLASLGDVQLVEKPEHWDVLRPYAEKLLDEALLETHDESVIAGYRTKLREWFAKVCDDAKRALSASQDLFAALERANPYALEMDQVAKLVAVDIGSSNDISLALHALKEAFGYRAFDDERVDPAELDDLGNRMSSYRNVRRLLKYDRELRTAAEYASQAIPSGKTFESIRKHQAKLASRLDDLRKYVDSEVALKTELLGDMESLQGERGSLAALVKEYAAEYAPRHDTVIGRIDDARERIERAASGEQMQALELLEGVKVLQPSVSGEVRSALNEMVSTLFACPSPSASSVNAWLLRHPIHECALTLETAESTITAADEAATQAERTVTDALDHKLEVLLSDAVRSRLAQGTGDPVIDAILTCESTEALREALVPAVLADAGVVATINRFLKQISVATVRLSEFTPSMATVESAQIPTVVEEFKTFLEARLTRAGDGADTLPMLKLEP